MMRYLYRTVLFGTAFLTMLIIVLGFLPPPDVPGRDPDSTLLLLRSFSGHPDPDALPPPTGRLNESCYREGPRSHELWCHDKDGIARNYQTHGLAPDEAIYLAHLERSRRGSDRRFVPLSEVKDLPPKDEAPLFPHAKDDNPGPGLPWPLLAAGVGGASVLALMLGAFFAMGGFGESESD